MASRFFRVPLDEVAYVRAIIEGYDGVAILRALDPNRGEIELLVGEGLESEADAMIARLEREAQLVPIPRPLDWK